MRAANLLYRGEITHQGTAYPGQHEAILDPELCQIVQDKLAANRRERALAVGAEAPSLLAGLIVDSDGNAVAECGPAAVRSGAPPARTFERKILPSTASKSGSVSI